MYDDEDDQIDDETFDATCHTCGKTFPSNEGAISADFDFCEDHATPGVIR